MILRAGASATGVVQSQLQGITTDRTGIKSPKPFI